LDFQKMTNPIVSVVMVVCNADRFLGESIEGILSQTFKDFEFIIVDFGSTDDSKGIISKYEASDSRLKPYTIPHCGLAEARNVSCSLARGQYIAVMDADDVSVPDRLALQVEFLENHPDVSILGGSVDWIDVTGRLLITRGNPANDIEIQSALFERCPLWHATVLMRREAFASVGGYRPSFAPAEDYDLWLRMSEHFRFANLQQVVLKYRIHPYQVSVRKRRNQTLGILAARVSATSRRRGDTDPLNSGEILTPELLAKLGVNEEAQNKAYAIDSVQWIRNLCQAGECSSALEEATELLKSSDWKYLGRRRIADLYLTIAGLYWGERKFLRCILAAGRAVIMRPKTVGRPLKPLLERLGLAQFVRPR
jgi:glycosyltransferase involved in cell wall biosynthesis